MKTLQDELVKAERERIELENETHRLTLAAKSPDPSMLLSTPKIQSLRDKLHANSFPVQCPIGAEENFQGVVDLITQKAYIFKNETLGAENQAPALRGGHLKGHRPGPG